MLRHLDITSKQEQANRSKELVKLTEASLSLLELIFPRHIIEYMTSDYEATGQEEYGGAAILQEDPNDPEVPDAPLGSVVARGRSGQPQVALSARQCLTTLTSAKDYRHLTTHHKQVGPDPPRQSGTPSSLVIASCVTSILYIMSDQHSVHHV